MARGSSASMTLWTTRREEFGRLVSSVSFGSVEELLGHPDIGVVDIATGRGPRADLMRKAFEAGEHVLAQKPLAASLHAARTAVEDAERHELSSP